ncbi:MAG: 23S rRNA (uracil(1939)-C(5))-methyltransferase RlmD [Gammaproteobacteria bacterium]|nr:23S rRNA (uracil(1939)-C(5))-methyltransferase RlmD [Gammaproteobacteria bacterium]NIR32862.1 23S rRNA (uracil(1939)-C(5))-methyltransferase RlmD [Gammaproteobacteria bacterium]NIR99408.1 23S rRNA (uracil(1939)-C(5))-methyltransferase RlmD [Gammaproteobacteria bacterium]NIT65022.1 23S rRNA (uracil(1939)-C(5))-methyltransferase RlmD [Gammaproteobacteria bacterium]NIV21937.1 23S rRNA (uracil(1939)-C(5))-methyltransferase RlmD [Gammaproteobacteria bacterium]
MSRSRTRRQRHPLRSEPVPARIEFLAHDGRGVARVDGKTVFVDGALPGEEVLLRYVKRRRDYDEAQVEELREASALRVEPGCPHYGVCGGCSLQHLAPESQIQHKQEILLQSLERLGGVRPDAVLAPLTGPHWGYRRKARLGVKHVIKKGRMLVGFRERRSSFVAELAACPVLHPAVGGRIEALAELIAGLRARDRIPQIEVAVGDAAAALVFRTLDELGPEDRERLIAFGRETGPHVHLQPGGIDSAAPLWPEAAPLEYALERHEVRIRFRPTDFTQVNAEINARMVDRALELLELSPGDRVLDLFCGLGNFTLPMARVASEVVGVEGDTGLVARARDNARRNGLANVELIAADLGRPMDAVPGFDRPYDKVLLDPPRSGAEPVIAPLTRLGARRIVYVACRPGSLARDAGELVHSHGYRLARVGVMDMFPHTAHVESIALFVRE